MPKSFFVEPSMFFNYVEFLSLTKINVHKILCPQIMFVKYNVLKAFWGSQEQIYPQMRKSHPTPPRRRDIKLFYIFELPPGQEIRGAADYFGGYPQSNRDYCQNLLPKTHGPIRKPKQLAIFHKNSITPKGYHFDTSFLLK